MVAFENHVGVSNIELGLVALKFHSLLIRFGKSHDIAIKPSPATRNKNSELTSW